MTKVRFLDLFAGCGGLSDGFEATGRFEGVAHVEWEEAPARTLVERLANTWGYEDAQARVFVTDVRILSGGLESGDADLLQRWEQQLARAGAIDVVIGGPPCQAYSVAGRVRDANGMHDDYRNYLFESYISLLRSAQPVAFIFENVPGMLSAAPGGIPIINRIRAAFSDAGFAISPDLKGEALLDAASFGVPQHRKRVIIAGFRRDAFADADSVVSAFYSSLRAKKVATLTTVREAIGDLPALLPQSKLARVSHAPVTPGVDRLHEPRFHSERDIHVFRMLAEDLASGEHLYRSIDALKALYTATTGREAAIHKYHVLLPDRPSNLIPAHLHKDGLRHIHWDPAQARSITAREAARLQSFPDDYPFQGARGDVYKMIGNAVPPKLSAAVAEALDFVLRQQTPNRGDK